MPDVDLRPRHARLTSKSQPGETNKDVESPREQNGEGRLDDATAVYIRSVLCAKPPPFVSPLDATINSGTGTPSEPPLPPLTSMDNVDQELYAMIAVLLAHFVQSWYNKMTHDAEFVDEIVKIIAHCTRGLEVRLRRVDIESLLLDDLPMLFISHLDAVRAAQESARASQILSQDRTMDEIYDNLRPHNALPVPVRDGRSALIDHSDEEAWCQCLVDAIVPLVLPPEDLVNPCLRVLVCEVFTGTIVHNAILKRTCEPWLLWEGATKLIYTLQPHTRPQTGTTTTVDRLETFGLLSSVSSDTTGLYSRHQSRLSTASLVFWATLQSIAVLGALLQGFFLAVLHLSPHDRRTTGMQPSTGPNLQFSLGLKVEGLSKISVAEPPKALISMHIWTFVNEIMSLQHRMPWLAVLVSLLRWLGLEGPGKLSRTNGLLDRLASTQLHRRLLNPKLLPPVLQGIRSAVFPGNALAPPRMTPTSEEASAIRQACAEAIVESIPEIVRPYYFATKQSRMMVDDIETVLDIFEDTYINKHLIIALVELFVARLFPELADLETAAL